MTAPVKNGQKHLESLRDGRRVFIDGKLVDDVTTHPAFRNSVQSSCALYDFQARPENLELMTYETETGRRVSRAWQKPRTYAEMVQRRQALTALAEQHHGFMGRAQENASFSSPGLSGCRLATKTSLAMIELVPSILAPRMVMPPESSSTMAATRSSPAWSPQSFERSACGLMIT